VTRRTLASIALALVAGALLVSPAGADSGPGHRSDGRATDWHGTPTNLGGRTQLSDGELVSTDYLYDDYGADVDRLPNQPAFRANLAPTSGDFRYPPAAKYGLNAADLREFRLALTQTNLFALVRLQTLKDRSTTAALIAIDSDGRRTTGAARWPAGAGIKHTPGADHFLLISGHGTWLYDARGHRVRVSGAVSTAGNALEATLPLKRLKLGSGARAWVLTGLATAGGTLASQRAGAPSAFDVGFQGAERYSLSSHWSDRRQSAALAAGNLSAFAYRLPVAAMRRADTRPFVPGPGFYNVIFRSRRTFGEGINPKTSNGDVATRIGGSAAPMFLGRYQPYGLYLPAGWRAGSKTPLTLDGHSLDVNQNQYRAVGKELPAYGDDRGAIVITPLARGIDTWYLDAGLGDVFEAWANVKRRFGADPERTSIAGYSMGGYMTYRLGLLKPDAFTAAVVHVGPPGYYQWPYPGPLQSTERWRVRGFTNLIVPNGLNLPFEIDHGNADELVPVSGVVKQADTFRTAGNPYRFYLHAADDHLTFILAGNFAHSRDWLGRTPPRRNLKPLRVRFVRYPSMDLPAYGLKWDAAYWVRDIVVRNASAVDANGRVDVTALTHRRLAPVAKPETPRVEPPGAGVSPATVTGQTLVPGPRTEQRNAFEGSLLNVRSVRLKTAWMGLRKGERISAGLKGDGPTTLRLEGRWPGAATLDGRPVTVTRTKKETRVTLDLAPGATHIFRLG
jgi:predicted esterase